MNFSGPFAGTNPLNSHKAPSGYRGADDSSLNDTTPDNDAKPDPFLHDDPRKWDPKLTVLNVTPLIYSNKNKPLTTSFKSPPWDVSKEMAEHRAIEKYNKEQLKTVFTEPKADVPPVWLAPQRQFDSAELLTGPERGYRRGRDPETDILLRSNAYQRSESTGLARNYDYMKNPGNATAYKMQPYDTSASSTSKNNTPDKTDLSESVPNAYRPPIEEDNKDVPDEDERENQIAREKKHEVEHKKVMFLGGLGILIMGILYMG